MRKYSLRTRRNRRGVTIIELTIALIVLVFLALASFFTLANLSTDSKAEASVAALEKMRLWSDTVLAKGSQADFDNFNVMVGPDSAQVNALRPLLGDNFRPQSMPISLAALCANASVPGRIKDRVSAALGLSSAAGVCPNPLPAGAGFAENGYPTPANTGEDESPFFVEP
jgi:type II secretory pathway pseudopilin PulG